MDERRRRLTFRCWRRGFRELDLILGHFANEYLADLDDAALGALEALLDQSDRDVYEWIVGQAEAPEEFDTPVLRRLQELRHLADTLWREAKPAASPLH